jgi:hypothetical protein
MAGVPPACRPEAVPNIPIGGFDEVFSGFMGRILTFDATVKEF